MYHAQKRRKVSSLAIPLVGIDILAKQHDFYNTICNKTFDFADFEECSKFFKTLINLFRQMNYAEWQSEKFADYRSQIEALVNEQLNK